MALNQIASEQNGEVHIRLLRAQRHLYGRSKRVLVWQMVLTVAVPLLGAVGTLAFAELKPWVALTALAIAIADTAVLDRLKKRFTSSAARVQEEFDCSVLRLPWNEFVVGKRLDPEGVHEAASEYAKGNNDSQLNDWYPPVVAEAPLHLARIICQRTNLWYDSKVRRRYGGLLVAVAAVMFLSLTVLSMATGLTLTNFVLVAVAPVTPFFSWAIREYYSQRDVADILDRVRAGSEALWERARTGQCGPDECEASSREFQDAIFTRRSSSTPVFDWIYQRMRSANEEQMNVGAEQLVKSISTGN